MKIKSTKQSVNKEENNNMKIKSTKQSVNKLVNELINALEAEPQEEDLGDESIEVDSEVYVNVKKEYLNGEMAQLAGCTLRLTGFDGEHVTFETIRNGAVVGGGFLTVEELLTATESVAGSASTQELAVAKRAHENVSRQLGELTTKYTKLVKYVHDIRSGSCGVSTAINAIAAEGLLK